MVFTAPRVGQLRRKETRRQKLNRQAANMTDAQLRAAYGNAYDDGTDELLISVLESEMDHRDAWL